MTDRDEDCRKELERLQEENDRLRRSAASFGALAERINVALQRERRSGRDRRGAARETPDRRQHAYRPLDKASEHEE
jgi:hypothetical protein